MCGPVGCAIVTFIDMCPECALGSVDVTKELFQLIAGDLVIGRQPGKIGYTHAQAHTRIGTYT